MFFFSNDLQDDYDTGRCGTAGRHFFVALRDRGDNSVERVLHTLKKSNKKDFPEIQDFC